MQGPQVMLARSRPISELDELQQRGYMFELKFDGVRGVVVRTPFGEVRIFNRNRADITFQYPDVVATWQDLGVVGVFDGEIICMDAEGRPDLESALARNAQAYPAKIKRLAAELPAMFIPFDALEVEGQDVRFLPYTERRGCMVATLEDQVQYSVASSRGGLMWEFVKQRGLEGLMAKRPDGPYLAGRHGSWVKLKAHRSVSVLVTGIVPGKGSRGPVGSLEIGLWDPKKRKLVSVGTVGSGLSAYDQCVIADLVDRKVPTVVEVRYLTVTGSGVLREPVFRGFRQDVAPQDCTIDTLER